LRGTLTYGAPACRPGDRPSGTAESAVEARKGRFAVADPREAVIRMMLPLPRATRMCAGACRAIANGPRYEPAMMLEAVMRQSGNVVWLHEPRAPSRTVARRRPERGLADVFVVGGLLTGLAFTAQQLVLALSMG
jgi:hypothetical protein